MLVATHSQALSLSTAGLERRLCELGWVVKVHETAGPFYWGAGTPMESR